MRYRHTNENLHQPDYLWNNVTHFPKHRMNYSNSFIPSYFNIRMRWEFKLATWQMQKEENEQSEKSDLLAVLNFVPHYLHVSLTEQDKSVSAKSSTHFKSPAMQQGPSRFTSAIILTSVLSKCWSSCPHWFVSESLHVPITSVVSFTA